MRIEVCEKVDEVDVADTVTAAVEGIEREYEFGVIILYAKK
jgi:hypothetical protein